MATGFLHLCDQVLVASSPHTPYDIPTKSLSTLLNEMTQYVAKTVNVENEDEAIVYGYRKIRKQTDVQMSIFLCISRLQLLLLSDIERVRAASLRALRYSIHRGTIFDKFLESRLDYLVCR